jgi:hypothetical protein
MSCRHKVLVERAAHVQDQPTKAKVQVVQTVVGEIVGVKGEGARSRSCGLFAHQVLTLVLARLVQ